MHSTACGNNALTALGALNIRRLDGRYWPCYRRQRQHSQLATASGQELKRFLAQPNYRIGNFIVTASGLLAKGCANLRTFELQTVATDQVIDHISSRVLSVATSGSG